MPATEVTEEIQNDLKILQMRSVLDPKHFYKKNDLKVLPKYFQVCICYAAFYTLNICINLYPLTDWYRATFCFRLL